mgnify:CR=1 FL=1
MRRMVPTCQSTLNDKYIDLFYNDHMIGYDEINDGLWIRLYVPTPIISI